MIDALRSGAWIKATRIRAYSSMLIVAYMVATVGTIVTAKGPMDALNRPIATDFSQVWAAGVSVLEGHPEKPFDPASHSATQRELFDPNTPFYGWHYPPYFLIPAAVLALFPYLWALLLWQSTTLLAYLWMVPKIVRTRYTILLAAAFPAVFVNIGHGHNGFLTAALMGGGLLCLERRPILAGLLFSTLAYKPQFALVIPLVLLVSRNWAAIAGGFFGIAALTAATVDLFGVRSWTAFRESLAFTRTVVLEQGSTGWEKIQSAFSAVRMWGGDVDTAYLAQGLVSAVAVFGVLWAWCGNADTRLKYAMVPAASILVTPYSLDYDLMIMAVGMAFFASYQLDKGFRSWEATLLVALWVAPILTRLAASALHFPLGLCTVSAFFALVSRRVAGDAQPALSPPDLKVVSLR